MALKRGQEDGEQQSAAKKAKHGFRVGPANLPDGPWKRKGWFPHYYQRSITVGMQRVKINELT